MITCFGLSLILNGLIVFFWHKKWYLKLGLKSYKGIQRIYLDETARLGGLVILITLCGYEIYNTDEVGDLLGIILFSLTPVIVIALKEDLFHNVKPAIRLLSLIFSAWIFRATYLGQFPILFDIPFVGYLLTLQGGVSLFYILGLTSIANGMNLIDGVNGLCGVVIFTILSSLLFLCYKTNDISMLSLILSIMVIIIPFILLNYPYGLIFLGDLGAYSLGLIVGMLCIIFFGRHPEISPWAAVLILIYPLTEVSFTIFRRLLLGREITSADKKHLHHLIHNFLRRKSSYKKIANSLVMPFLTLLWIIPLIMIPWVYANVAYILFGIFLFVGIYFFIYRALSYQ
jgi:UDP-GlcNAc:undecaprenyl-phosphate GlcNAc-1-phosphate transferase